VDILLVGVGVIGTVYGTQLARAGHAVDVLAHGSRTLQVERAGLCSKDTTTGISYKESVRVVTDGRARSYDLVIVSVWLDQIPSVVDCLRSLVGAPAVLFFGNNPSGRRGPPGGLRGPIHLGFPGVGGTLVGDVVEYMRIPQQPTTLEVGGGRAIEELASSLLRAGFAVSRTGNMDGWLAYHGVFVASVSAALYRAHGSAAELAANRPALTLMCRSIEEGFHALARQRVGGAPRNLRTLHRRALRAFAVWYWARTMRSEMGEQCFAAHARHAVPEMRKLAADAVERVGNEPHTDHLRRLLDRA